MKSAIRTCLLGCTEQGVSAGAGVSLASLAISRAPLSIGYLVMALMRGG
jgi:hypothetical protein